MLYEHARVASAEVECAQSVVRRRIEEPSGSVRMTVSVAMLHFELVQKLPQLLDRHPKLHVSVHATDSFVDVAEDGFAITVRRAFAPLPDSELTQKRIRVESLILVASPHYLDRQGTPQAPFNSPSTMRCRAA